MKIKFHIDTGKARDSAAEREKIAMALMHLLSSPYWEKAEYRRLLAPCWSEGGVTIDILREIE